MPNTIHWFENPATAVKTATGLLRQGGKAVVTPTKVGYIISTVDAGGLERKFDLKQRAKRKPAVVLCSSVEQLRELAVTNEQIDQNNLPKWTNRIATRCTIAGQHLRDGYPSRPPS